MKNFKKDQIQNLDKVIGGVDVNVKITNVFNGVKWDEDIKITIEKEEKEDTLK